jgi:hypothetical protein
MTKHSNVLSDWLNQVFPNGFRDTDFDVSRILTGFEEHMPREIKDARIPMNWTETELQWDPICNSLFDHVSQTGEEALGWMFVKMISDRIHGQWRITGNGGRVSDLSVLQYRKNWLFAMRARLGVVDGWLRQNGSRPYSKYLFEALSNSVLMTISPKRRLWNLELEEDVQMFYGRLVDVLNLPVSSEWLQSIDSLLQVSVFSDVGVQRVDDIQSVISQASKREQKRWGQSDVVALQTVLRHAQQKTLTAHVINQCWIGESD